MRMTNCNPLLECFPDLRVYFSVVPDDPSTLLCIECGLTTSNKTTLLYHVIAKHLELKPFRCTECPKAAAIYSTIQQHTARAHGAKGGEEDGKHAGRVVARSSASSNVMCCSVCGETFPAPLHLLHHFFGNHWYEIQLERERKAAATENEKEAYARAESQRRKENDFAEKNRKRAEHLHGSAANIDDA